MKNILFLLMLIPAIGIGQMTVSVEGGVNNHRTPSVGFNVGVKSPNGVIMELGMIDHCSSRVNLPAIFTLRAGYEMDIKPDVWSGAITIGGGYQLYSNDKKNMNKMGVIGSFQLFRQLNNWPVKAFIGEQIINHYFFSSVGLKGEF